MTRKIETLAVVGSGYMGGGIAQSLALTGCTVYLTDADAQRARDSHARLLREAEAFESAGLFPAGSTATLKEKLIAAESIEAIGQRVDYVAEVVPENLELKLDVLKRIEAAVRPDCIIATNTSAIPIKTMAPSLQHPSRFLGVHWMNPAPFVPAVEIIPGADTSEDVVAASEALVQAAGKVTARVADVAGFVANRLQFALFKEAVAVVEEGLATPEDVDKVVSNSFGFRLALFGPFAIADMAGLDVYAASYGSLERQYGPRFSVPAGLKQRVDQGDLGLKTGGGFLGLPPSCAQPLAAYRNKAYQRLMQLRQELGEPPFGASEG
ncbi:3-hydroxyacyl-CoA dehydrogenase family protein [Chitinasiproducens palmae]|uniref:3-hydroxyacyl-CoA dehydrogenase n=1 Tax=Chitinasiproducens palmae TaxID=1770053 RepID=A0A1H2PW02_9BURK|nr:3-hydroxyacyl-CoA dehydrogenase family protein [Chitinasiproducens palmae]SDV51501.1 3-hydroxyacyl-CoA dehydrogenase [Chitinasiproducens palmae]